MNLARKFAKKTFRNKDFSKDPILFVSGNTLLLLFLALYELDLPGIPLRSILEGIPLYFLSFLTLMAFCGSWCFIQKRQTDRIGKELGSQKEALEKTVTLLEEVSAFYRSGAEISADMDGARLSDLITRESLKSLQAHRAILFLGGEGNDQLRVGSVFASERSYETANLNVEKECACRILRQKKPLLLREPRDFSELLPNEGKNRNGMSLLGVPLIRLEKALGVITVSILDGTRKFNEKELEWLSLFSQHASAAIRKSIDGGSPDLQPDYDRELEKIAAQLRGLRREEREKILAHFQDLLAKREGEKGEGIPDRPGNSISRVGSQRQTAQSAEKREEEKSCILGRAKRPLSFPKSLEMMACSFVPLILLHWGSIFYCICTMERGMSPSK